MVNFYQDKCNNFQACLPDTPKEKSPLILPIMKRWGKAKNITIFLVHLHDKYILKILKEITIIKKR